jgi:hypothetical protein
MADAARDGAMFVFAGKLIGVSTGLRVRSAIGVPFKCDCGDRDHRKLRQSLLQIGVFWFTFGKREAPAVIVNDDGDVIGIVERSRAALEGGIIEVPFRRGELPDKVGKITTVFVVAVAAAVGGKVILVPPFARPWAAAVPFRTPGCRSGNRSPRR